MAPILVTVVLSETCGYCKKFKPEIDAAEPDLAEAGYRVERVVVQENPDHPLLERVSGYPSTFVQRPSGVTNIPGYMPAAEWKQAIMSVEEPEFEGGADAKRVSSRTLRWFLRIQDAVRRVVRMLRPSGAKNHPTLRVIVPGKEKGVMYAFFSKTPKAKRYLAAIRFNVLDQSAPIAARRGSFPLQQRVQPKDLPSDFYRSIIPSIVRVIQSEMK